MKKFAKKNPDVRIRIVNDQTVGNREVVVIDNQPGKPLKSAAASSLSEPRP